MKKVLLLIAALFTAITFAQVPQGISYQAIALNGSGNPVVNSNVGVRLSILDNSATGTILYTETHIKTTNTQGLFNLVIGQGTPVTGTFTGINWATNSKFLKAEIDVAGGTNYVLVGSTQLLSVPYALTAGSYASSSGNTLSDEVNNNRETNFGFVDDGGNKVAVYNSKTATWSSQTFNGSYTPTLIESNGSFGFVDDGDNKVYVFSAFSGNWTVQTFNGSYSPTLTVENGNFGFVDDGANIVYAFNSKTGLWTSQAFDGSYSPTLVNSNGKFGFIDDGANKVYVFYQQTGAWIAQSFNGSYTPTLIDANGNFGFIDDGANICYVFNQSTGTWVGQAFNGAYTPDLISSTH